MCGKMPVVLLQLILFSCQFPRRYLIRKKGRPDTGAFFIAWDNFSYRRMEKLQIDRDDP
jgi:hypothetical protein